MGQKQIYYNIIKPINYIPVLIIGTVQHNNCWYVLRVARRCLSGVLMEFL